MYIRFGTEKGYNLDYLVSWAYTAAVYPPPALFEVATLPVEEPPAEGDPTSTEVSAPPPAPAAAPVETTEEPLTPATIVMHMVGGGDVTLVGAEAETMLGFLVNQTGTLT